MRTFIIALALVLSSCSSGGDSSSDINTKELKPQFAGTWNLTYNVVIDECELTTEGTATFEDTQVVTQDGDDITVTSEVLPVGLYTGAVRGDDSYLAESILEGDLFGIGLFCELIEKIAYNKLESDSAESVYSVQIICDDGSRCDSAIRGAAKRS